MCGLIAARAAGVIRPAGKRFGLVVPRPTARALHSKVPNAHLPFTPAAEDVPALTGEGDDACRRLGAEVAQLVAHANLIFIGQHAQRKGGKAIHRDRPAVRDKKAVPALRLSHEQGSAQANRLSCFKRDALPLLGFAIPAVEHAPSVSRAASETPPDERRASTGSRKEGGCYDSIGGPASVCAQGYPGIRWSRDPQT